MLIGDAVLRTFEPANRASWRSDCHSWPSVFPTGSGSATRTRRPVYVTTLIDWPRRLTFTRPYWTCWTWTDHVTTRRPLVLEATVSSTTFQTTGRVMMPPLNLTGEFGLQQDTQADSSLFSLAQDNWTYWMQTPISYVQSTRYHQTFTSAPPHHRSTSPQHSLLITCTSHSSTYIIISTNNWSLYSVCSTMSLQPASFFTASTLFHLSTSIISTSSVASPLSSSVTFSFFHSWIKSYISFPQISPTIDSFLTTDSKVFWLLHSLRVAPLNQSVGHIVSPRDISLFHSFTAAVRTASLCTFGHVVVSTLPQVGLSSARSIAQQLAHSYQLTASKKDYHGHGRNHVQLVHGQQRVQWWF